VQILGFDRSHGRTCLHYASKNGHTDSVRMILEGAQRGPVSQSWGLARFANLRDCRGMTALHMASRMGHAAVVRLLLDSGSLVSATTTTFGNG
jgi:E3 ubiquitin-protein ligase XBAT32/33